jgi:hypothetical protein
MQIDEGKLRAYLDQALSPDELAEVKKQLADSPETQAVLARLSQERNDFTPYLAALAPPAEHRPDVFRAWRRLQVKIMGQSTSSKITKIIERTKMMFSQSFMKRYQPVIAILSVVAIIAISFSFAPVRAMAGNLLKIFRVQTVKVIPVDKDYIEALENNPNLKQLVDEFKPEIEVITKSEPQKVDSLAQAAELAGFPVAQITAVPEDIGAPSITVYQQKVVHLNLDKDLLEAIFEAAEIEISLPDSLDEEPIIITQPNTVVQEWYQEDKKILGFVQMTTPAVEYPDDLDLNALGVAGLQLLGMSKEEATALGATIDWANTIILPIPNESDVTVTEISINGAKGFVFAPPDSTDDEAAIMWSRNGMSYFIVGNYPAEQIIGIAKSVK